MYLASVLAGLWLSVAQVPVSGPPPKFEVASIKLNTSGSGVGVFSAKLGRVSAQNLPLNWCIQYAFDVWDEALFSGPNWLDSEQFDIEAKAPGPADRAELMRMPQSFLTLGRLARVDQ